MISNQITGVRSTAAAAAPSSFAFVSLSLSLIDIETPQEKLQSFCAF